MTSKDSVLRAIAGEYPPRVPILYCNRDIEHSDVLGTGFAPAAGFVPAQPGMTEWGYAWKTLDGTMGQPANHPLADDHAIAAYRPPDPRASGRLTHIPKWAAQHKDKFLTLGMGISGFNQATFLRGFEQLLCDLHANPSLAARVLDFVFEFENGIIDQLHFNGTPYSARHPAGECRRAVPDRKPRYSAAQSNATRSPGV